MSHNINITRKAVLIGCPGDRNNFLEGVKQDIKNICNYLKSDKGGAWYDSEIEVIYNPTFDKVSSVVHSVNVDYTFIYFSGHGFTNTDDHRMLCLKDYDMSDKFLLNESPRQLIIVDACRNYIAPGITGIPDFGEQWDHFDATSPIHDLFDKYIENSPNGKLIIHATKQGEFSYDSPNGGYFTQALLHVSTRIKNKNNCDPVHIYRILDYIPTVLQRHNNYQVPSITFRKGNLMVPFAFAIPSFSQKRSIPHKNPIPQISSNVNLVYLGLFAFFVIGITAITSE